MLTQINKLIDRKAEHHQKHGNNQQPDSTDPAS